MAPSGATARVARSGASALGATHRHVREATRELHARAERQLAPLLVGPGVSAASVRAALAALLGFYAPLEHRLRAALAAPPPRPLPPALPSASASALPFPLVDRARLIERDLAALGVAPDDIARLPRCRDLPAVGGAVDAAGCLYVVEGAQLGGQVIARELARRLGLGQASGGGFFAGEAAGTAARWRQVLSWLETLGDAAAVAAAARATFDSLSRWLVHAGVAA